MLSVVAEGVLLVTPVALHPGMEAMQMHLQSLVAAAVPLLTLQSHTMEKNRRMIGHQWNN